MRGKRVRKGQRGVVACVVQMRVWCVAVCACVCVGVVCAAWCVVVCLAPLQRNKGQAYVVLGYVVVR